MTFLSLSVVLQSAKVQIFIMRNFLGYELKLMKMAEYLYDLIISRKKPENQFLLTSTQL